MAVTCPAQAWHPSGCSLNGAEYEAAEEGLVLPKYPRALQAEAWGLSSSPPGPQPVSTMAGDQHGSLGNVLAQSSWDIRAN